MDGNTMLEKPSITFLTKDSRSVELRKRVAKGISLLTKYVIISVFLRKDKWDSASVCFSDEKY